MLLERHKKKSFLHWIVIGDKKWIHYDNPKRKKSYVKPGHPAKSMAKPNIHGANVILCIWWDQKGVLYYELLKLGETINGKRYRTHLIRLKRAIAKKRPEYATRHEVVGSSAVVLREYFYLKKNVLKSLIVFEKSRTRSCWTDCNFGLCLTWDTWCVFYLVFFFI